MKQRFKILIQGAVQGVGFRPFIYKLACELNLNGIIANNVNGVSIDVEGDEGLLNEFISRIKFDKPRHSVINSINKTKLELNGYDDFKIIESESSGEPNTIILPDIAVCNECFYEMLDPENRRYLYPFINCTNCGPRFSIIDSLPYDRPNTSMKNFEMCDQCREEYENPLDRRFHAQPIACPKCGPQVQLLNHNGKLICEKEDAISEAFQKIKEGRIIALKGLGGFQLIVNAVDDNAVRKLRERKHRDEKPFALMFPSIEMIHDHCIVSGVEKNTLVSSESPIVLLKKKSFIRHQASSIQHPASSISESVAPKNPYLGVMLPYTPLHYLLMQELGEPIIATSGNISEEPMCIDENEAIEKLSGIADYFLIHNRPIVRPVDDSIVRVIKQKPTILRRARGYAPLPISIRNAAEENFVCVGGHLKNTISMKKGNEVFISQHIGDLENTEAEKYFCNTISDFKQMYKVNPDYLVHDLHPDYLSSKFCHQQKAKTIPVQHHLAHIAGCYEENNLEGKCFAVCWDGTGFGLDNTIWGGEFFIYSEDDFNRAAHFRKFRIPGGDAAVKDARRSLTGILYEIFGNAIPFSKLNLAVPENDLRLFTQMLNKNLNCFETTSVGRIFDAVSSLLSICSKSSYEGQAAMMLEFAADQTILSRYDFNLTDKSILIFDWQPMFEQMFIDLEKEISVSEISAKFHNTLAEIIATLANRAAQKNVVLTGGCFQNVLLLELTINRLTENGFIPYWNQKIPTNDGGISFGQAVFANHLIIKNKQHKLVKTESERV
ncbi:MAG: carbamoyltransferase HypF [Ignavibacterium sp.]|nr:carbamoyltransferase HypF [Ignavibacterium sp.]